jgi:hypothetical protein
VGLTTIQALSTPEQHSLDATRSAIDALEREKDKPFGDPTEIKYSGTIGRPGEVVLCNPSSGAFTVELQSLTAGDVGKTIAVKNHSASTNTITVSGAGVSIDGASSATITTARGSLLMLIISTTELVVL